MRTREDLDAEHDLAAPISLKEEELFALLGVFRQRAVREPEAIRFVDNVNDPTDGDGEPEWERRSECDSRAARERTVGSDAEPRAPLRPPVSKRLTSPREQVGAVADQRDELLIAISAGDSAGQRRTDRLVREGLRPLRPDELDQPLGCRPAEREHEPSIARPLPRAGSRVLAEWPGGPGSEAHPARDHLIGVAPAAGARH